jgi:hypothetical protein
MVAPANFKKAIYLSGATIDATVSEHDMGDIAGSFS